MPAKRGTSLRARLRSAINTLVDRILGEDADEGWESIDPGDQCVMVQSVVGANNGVLLKGSKVEFTGVQDRSGRLQIKVLGIPDHEWTESSRLPYGPGFVLYVDPRCLRRHKEIKDERP